MRILRLGWRPFAIPFAAALEAAYGTHTLREGLLLRIHCEDGTIGIGEASPLPGFGGGTVADCAAVLRTWASQFISLTPEEARVQLARLAEHNTHVPALLFGLETAFLDAEGRRRDVPIAVLLNRTRRVTIAVNATIAVADAASATDLARAAVAAGFGAVKLKVAMAQSARAEIDRIERVRDAIGAAAELRIDANGGWSVGRAIEVLRAVRPARLELVEQPVPAHDLDGLRRVRRSGGVPVAADEAVRSIADARAILAAGAADALVLKPTVLGGTRLARSIVDEATRAGVQTIVTSTLESGVGVAAAIQLAATMPDTSPACGLATGTLLDGDLLRRRIVVADGAIVAPTEPGLGVQLDEAQLAQYATSPWQFSS